MIEHYQTFAWLIISALGASLVCSLEVAGEQVVAPRAHMHRVRGALPILLLAALAVMMQLCFPRYYAVGYGCIRLLWLLLAMTFVFQALANKYGRLQRISGLLAPLALGLAVAPTIFGVDYDDYFGFSIICSWKAWILAAANLLLALFLGTMRTSRRLLSSIYGIAFAITFITLLCLMIGTYTFRQNGFEVETQPFGILENLSSYWYCGFSLSIGLILMFAALMGNIVMKDFKFGYFLLVIGAFLSYFAIICAAGLDDAAILPVVDNPQQSVTLSNGSAPLLSLKNTTITTSIIIIAIVFLIFRNFAENFSRK